MQVSSLWHNLYAIALPMSSVTNGLDSRTIWYIASSLATMAMRRYGLRSPKPLTPVQPPYQNSGDSASVSSTTQLQTVTSPEGLANTVEHMIHGHFDSPSDLEQALDGLVTFLSQRLAATTTLKENNPAVAAVQPTNTSRVHANRPAPPPPTLSAEREGDAPHQRTPPSSGDSSLSSHDTTSSLSSLSGPPLIKQTRRTIVATSTNDSSSLSLMDISLRPSKGTTLPHPSSSFSSASCRLTPPHSGTPPNLGAGSRRWKLIALSLLVASMMTCAATVSLSRGLLALHASPSSQPHCGLPVREDTAGSIRRRTSLRQSLMRYNHDDTLEGAGILLPESGVVQPTSSPRAHISDARETQPRLPLPPYAVSGHGDNSNIIIGSGAAADHIQTAPLPLLEQQQQRGRRSSPYAERYNNRRYKRQVIDAVVYADSEGPVQMMKQQQQQQQAPPQNSESPREDQCNAPRRANVESAVRVTFDFETTLKPRGNKKQSATDDETTAAALTQVMEAMSAPEGDPSSAYHTFFAARNAVFETISSVEGCGKTNTTAISEPLCARATPFSLDVVYTYVNPNALSHQTAVQQHCNGDRHCRDERFRDWNELLYSMRSVYERGMCTNDAASGSGKRCGEVIPDRGAFVRRVFVVVGNHDQVPEWLVQDSHVTIVTHEELFASEADKLPTLNSHAIESVLHRIPGLSKYFVYFNNDMFWGRRISFLDYFRPLSLTRMNHRIRRYHVEPSTTTSKSSRRRVTLWFEPIFYFERPEDDRECQMPHASLEQQRKNAMISPLSECSTRPIPAYRVFDIRCRQASSRDYWRAFSNVNKRLMFERIPGAWPSHSFAHYPRLMDREILTEMLDVDFLDVAQTTRTRRVRDTNSLWTTYVYQYYAINCRREIDSALVVALGQWQRPPHQRLGDCTHLSEIIPGADEKNLAMPTYLQPIPDGQLRNRLLANAFVREKAENVLVSMDGKQANIYHFCLLQDIGSLFTYRYELQQTMKLFVTLNDDFYYVTGMTRTLVTDLLKVIAGDAANASPPWEKQQ